MTIDSAPVSLPRTRRIPLGRDPLGDPVEVWVAEPVPGARPLPPGPRRVLWVMDANLFFGTVVETSRLMAGLFGELPPVLVAGLAYPEADPWRHALLRARDFTPTVDAGFLASAPEGAAGEVPGLGGADAFADLLLGPAREAVRSRFDTVPDAHVVFGSSLGGLFVLDLLERRPAAFRGYVAVSPALWWDDGLLLRRAGARPADAEPRVADVHLAVGRGEEGDHLPFLAPWKMVTHVETMAGLLAGTGESELRVAHAVVEGESHTSVVQPGLTRGLRWVLGRR